MKENLPDKAVIAKLIEQGYVVEYTNPYADTFPQRYTIWQDKTKTKRVYPNEAGEAAFLQG